MLSEKELRNIYEKYIKRKIYRVVPKRALKEILSIGIDPKKSPYKKIIPKVEIIYNLVKILDKKGININYMRGKTQVSALFTSKELFTDLSKKYIDFCASLKHTEYYLKVIPGGGVPNAIVLLTDSLLKNNLPINTKEKNIILNLNKWAKSLICENTVIYVMGDSKIFETALFQVTGKHKKKKRTEFKESKYLKSPFGSFKNFKEVIRNQGLRKYIYRLKTDNFYLRVKNKISPKEIKKI